MPNDKPILLASAASLEALKTAIGAYWCCAPESLTVNEFHGLIHKNGKPMYGFHVVLRGKRFRFEHLGAAK
jgi:hypothetical protein